MPNTIQNAVDNALVLCIDDDPAILECEQRFLEAFGYTVLTALSGSKGLELASIHSVDVVIVDYCMPDMNGPEVAIEIKRLKPHAPIIMLSGSVDIPKKALAVVDAFVAKDRLGSQLLPAIAELHKGGASMMRSTLYDQWNLFEARKLAARYLGCENCRKTPIAPTTYFKLSNFEQTVASR